MNISGTNPNPNPNSEQDTLFSVRDGGLYYPQVEDSPVPGARRAGPVGTSPPSQRLVSEGHLSKVTDRSVLCTIKGNLESELGVKQEEMKALNNSPPIIIEEINAKNNEIRSIQKKLNAVTNQITTLDSSASGKLQGNG